MWRASCGTAQVECLHKDTGSSICSWDAPARGMLPIPELFERVRAALCVHSSVTNRVPSAGGGRAGGSVCGVGGSGQGARPRGYKGGARVQLGWQAGCSRPGRAAQPARPCVGRPGWRQDQAGGGRGGE